MNIREYLYIHEYTIVNTRRKSGIPNEKAAEFGTQRG